MAYYRIRDNGSYELRMAYGKKLDGTPLMHTRTFNPPDGLTEHQLLVVLDDEIAKFENDIKKGTEITAYSTFNEAADFWLENEGKTKLAPKTHERYRDFARRIHPTAIGNSKIKDITPQDLNIFYRQLAEPGANKHTGKGLSAKTIREHHGFISRILEICRKWGCIDENVATRADPPINRAKPIDVMDDEEIAEVLRLLDTEEIKYKVAITLLIMYGLRKGELCGLEWKDINFRTMTIRICRSSQYVDKKIITKSTKTYRERTISMDPYTADLLTQYREWYDVQRDYADKFWVESDRLFIKKDGSPIHPDTIGDWWNKFQVRAGFEKHHTLHSLRHTNASLLIACDTDVATVAGRLGHSDATTTLKIYTHQFKAKDVLAAQNLADFATSALGLISDPQKEDEQTA